LWSAQGCAKTKGVVVGCVDAVVGGVVGAAPHLQPLQLQLIPSRVAHVREGVLAICPSHELPKHVVFSMQPEPPGLGVFSGVLMYT